MTKKVEIMIEKEHKVCEKRLEEIEKSKNRKIIEKEHEVREKRLERNI